MQVNFIDYLKPFTLNRVSADRFVTLDSVCTHSDCTGPRGFFVVGVKLTEIF